MSWSFHLPATRARFGCLPQAQLQGTRHPAQAGRGWKVASSKPAESRCQNMDYREVGLDCCSLNDEVHEGTVVII